jgi:hypothetical protein
VLAGQPRLPLGVPARLVRDADALAARLLLAPACAAAPGAGVEREAGYALLGALCAALPPEQLAARRGAMPALWAPALGPGAAAALDLTKYAAPGAPDQVRPARHPCHGFTCAWCRPSGDVFSRARRVKRTPACRTLQGGCMLLERRLCRRPGTVRLQAVAGTPHLPGSLSMTHQGQN